MSGARASLRWGCLALCAVLASSSESMPAAGASVDASTADSFALHRKDTPQVTVHVWDQGGVTHEAGPDSQEKPLANASTLRVRVFRFHDGTVYETKYPKGAHISKTSMGDITAYLISGHVIETAGGGDHDMYPGDAYFLAASTPETKMAVEPSTMVSFEFPPTGAPPIAPVFLSDKDLPSTTGSEWATGDGENHAALTPEQIAKAPSEARRFYGKTYGFPRWRIMQSRIEKGMTSGWHGGGPNGIGYLIEGREIIHYPGGVTEDILPGDVFREPGQHRTETPADTFLIKGGMPATFDTANAK